MITFTNTRANIIPVLTISARPVRRDARARLETGRRSNVRMNEAADQTIFSCGNARFYPDRAYPGNGDSYHGRFGHRSGIVEFFPRPLAGFRGAALAGADPRWPKPRGFR